MRELSFGARVADSFVKKLKWETAKADDELPGVLPSLCAEERQRYEQFGPRSGQRKRIDFAEGLEAPIVNRLAPPAQSRVILIKEREWVLSFDKRKHSPEATFEIDGLELHISEAAQAELKGSTIRVINDRIVVSHD